MSIAKSIVGLIMIGAVTTASADTLSRITPELSDWVDVLESQGYNLYAFDISQLTDTTWDIRFQIREYVGDSLVSTDVMIYNPGLVNRRMISDFPEESRAEIKESEMYSAEKGIYTCGEKLTISVLPPTDKHKLPVGMAIPEIGSFYQYLTMKPISGNETAEEIYRYHVRPFTVSNFKEGEFIPLTLIGSAWFDPKFNIFRFCGESEIDPEFKAHILKEIPHYYVVGVTFTKK